MWGFLKSIIVALKRVWRQFFSDFHMDVVELINLERNKKDLPLLKAQTQLHGCAQGHSDEMAVGKHLTHFGADGSYPQGRMIRAGYKATYSGECVAWGQQTPEDVVKAWMGDSLHRNILLSKNYVHIGVGENTKYWTADFAAGGADDDNTPLTQEDFNLWS